MGIAEWFKLLKEQKKLRGFNADQFAKFLREEYGDTHGFEKYAKNRYKNFYMTFDKRFKRIMQQEQNAFFNREEQRRRQLGLSPVIITSVTGFVNNGGNNTVATLKQVKERGISDIGLQDKAIGLK